MERVTSRELARDRPFWLIAFAGPLIWTVHFLISYLLVEAACKVNFLRTSVLGVSTLSVIVVIVTIIALAASGYMIFLSRRTWLQMRQTNRDNQRGSPGTRPYRWADTTQEFLAFSGFLLSPLFTLLILITGVPALVLQPCVW